MEELERFGRGGIEVEKQRQDVGFRNEEEEDDDKEGGVSKGKCVSVSVKLRNHLLKHIIICS